MRKIKVLFIDEEMEYVSILAKNLSNFDSRLSTTVMDATEWDLEEFNKYSRTYNEYNLIVFDSDKYIKEEEDGVIDRINYAILTEDPGRVDRSIFRYQPIDVMAAEIIMHAGLENYSFSRGDKGRSILIGVCSGAGNVGKTSIAIMLARNLMEERGQKVLYLNMEEFNSSQIYLAGSTIQKQGIDEFLYYLFNDRQPENHIEAYLNQDKFGVEFFNGNEGRNVLKSLSKEELDMLFHSLTKTGRYDYIIIDCNSDGSDETAFLTEQFSKIIYVTSGSTVERKKDSQWFNHFLYKEGNSLNTKIIYTQNKSESTALTEKEASRFSGSAFVAIPLDYDSFQDTDGHIYISNAKSFSFGVRELMEEVVRFE